MSTTISSTSASLANALLSLAGNTNSTSSGLQAADPDANLNLDSLQLSGSSLADLETQAQEIAAQNQNSVISSSEEALSVNLQAVAAILGGNPSVQAAQGTQDPSSVVNLV